MNRYWNVVAVGALAFSLHAHAAEADEACARLALSAPLPDARLSAWYDLNNAAFLYIAVLSPEDDMRKALIQIGVEPIFLERLETLRQPAYRQLVLGHLVDAEQRIGALQDQVDEGFRSAGNTVSLDSAQQCALLLALSGRDPAAGARLRKELQALIDTSH